MNLFAFKKIFFLIAICIYFSPQVVFAVDCCVYYKINGDGPPTADSISGALDLPAVLNNCPEVSGYIFANVPSTDSQCVKGKSVLSSAKQEILKIVNEATNKIVPESSGGGAGLIGSNSSGLEELNRLGTKDVRSAIGKIIKTAMGIMGSISLVMFVYAGFLWMVSGASSDKNQKAKDIFVWATLGIVVIFASYAIVDVIFGAF